MMIMKKCKLKLSYFLGALIMMSSPAFSQQSEKKSPTWNFKNGIGMVVPDSLFSINFRFRMQNRASYTTLSEDDLSASIVEARVRRLRMRFEGFMLNPKLTYYIQLSFSRGDMDWNGSENSVVNSSPNIVRDAVIYYRPSKKVTLMFGQTKLPGNRQRVVSSGDLQFADRSIVNAAFNIDRDFGFQGIYEDNIANLTYLLKGAITSGEGRNSSFSDYGLAYTGRAELLPFGKFTNKGDYFEGDLEREPMPKLSIAGGYHYNESAKRTAGTLGKDIYQPRNLSAFIADVLFKYKGFAFSAEYLTRNTDNPVTIHTDGSERAVFAGEGKMAQTSYIFKNNFELAGRYAIVTPSEAIQNNEVQIENYTAGVTKYLKGHRVKLQSNATYGIQKDFTANSTIKQWTWVFQMELGI